ncbi:MAG: hypothetical protein AAGK97_16115, partial [Bacteroidota bacterium]
MKIIFKLSFLFYRLGETILKFPERLWFILKHPANLIPQRKYYYEDTSSFQKYIWWSIELPFLLFDLIGIFDLYEGIVDLIKINTRKLTQEEIKIGKSVFGNSINWERVRIDLSSHLGPKQHQFVYVSFYTINSYGPFNMATFIHELMHIWQYEKVGAVYIPRALFAQQTIAGYDYGGLEGLEKAKSSNGNIWSFNYEQQADIVADYFR